MVFWWRRCLVWWQQSTHKTLIDEWLANLCVYSMGITLQVNSRIESVQASVLVLLWWCVIVFSTFKIIPFQTNSFWNRIFYSNRIHVFFSSVCLTWIINSITTRFPWKGGAIKLMNVIRYRFYLGLSFKTTYCHIKFRNQKDLTWNHLKWYHFILLFMHILPCIQTDGWHTSFTSFTQ